MPTRQKLGLMQSVCSNGHRRIDRQNDADGRAVRDSALDAQPAAVREDNVLDDGQLQAGAAQFARPGLVHPVEALGESRDVRLGDAVAGVGNRDLKPVSLGVRFDDGDALLVARPQRPETRAVVASGAQRRRDTNLAPGRRVFDGVVDQVDQDLVQTVAIAAEWRQIGWQGLREADCATICDAENLRAAAAVLDKVTIRTQSFEKIRSKAGDVVYCNPPYDDTFTGYTGRSFGADD